MLKTLTGFCKAYVQPVPLFYSNGTGIFWIEAYREDHTIKRKTGMRTKQIAGLIGSVTLFIGVFVPLISIPTIENLNYFTCSKKSDVMITLVLAIMSFILVLAKKFKALWFTGNFRILRPHIAGIQFEWGWALLIIGPALIIVSAAMESFKKYKMF